MKRIALVLFLSLAVHGQAPYIVRSAHQPNLAIPAPPWSDEVFALGEYVYFNAWDRVRRDADGKPADTLWRTDGTPEGTIELTKIPVGHYERAGKWLVFRSRTPPHEAWITDGTPEGTRAAPEVLRTEGIAVPSIQFTFGDTAVVYRGDELWAMPLPAGTPAVRLGVKGRGGLIAASPGRALFFSGTALMWTDGTAAGTSKVVALTSHSSSAVRMGDFFYFFRRVDDDLQIWKTDGTPESTLKVVSVPDNVQPTPVAAGRNLFFTANQRLWVSDGTAAGTRELPAEPRTPLARLGDGVVFKGAAVRPIVGEELWISDGTPEGTRTLPSGFEPYGFLSIGDRVYFKSLLQEFGEELWVTDGTADGTRMVADLAQFQTSSMPTLYASAGERIYFHASDLFGRYLWALRFAVLPRLVVAHALAQEGGVAKFRVTLSNPSAEPVLVEYGTADGTATSHDYEPVSGTLTFAAGETVKDIDVAVHDDSHFEPSETFSLTLRHPAGATLQQASAVALLDDDDRHADLALAVDLSRASVPEVSVVTTNHGPGTARDIRHSRTATPIEGPSTNGFPAVPQIAPGGSVRQDNLFCRSSRDERQQYLTWTIASRERDLNPTNNTAQWTSTQSMAMDALYLAPGQEATVWYYPGATGNLQIESSAPGVLSAPATLTVAPLQRAVSFVVRGVAPGTTALRVVTSSGTVGTLDIAVVETGTKLRWPGGITARAFTEQPINHQGGVAIQNEATAPFSGRNPTGLVRVSAYGREVGRVRLTDKPEHHAVMFYLADVGNTEVTVEYEGDETFLPSTTRLVHGATRGTSRLAASLRLNGTVVTVNVRVYGSPAAAPTGSITVSEPGVFAPISGALRALPDGSSEATVTLPPLDHRAHAFSVIYPGDERYAGSHEWLQYRPKTRPKMRSVRR